MDQEPLGSIPTLIILTSAKDETYYAESVGFELLRVIGPQNPEGNVFQWRFCMWRPQQVDFRALKSIPGIGRVLPAILAKSKRSYIQI